jgi:hypothetical protein
VGFTGIRADVRRSPGKWLRAFIKHKNLLFFPFFSFSYDTQWVPQEQCVFYLFFPVPNFRFFFTKKSWKFWGNVFTGVILTKFANI